MAKIKFQYFSKIKNKNFIRNSFLINFVAIEIKLDTEKIKFIINFTLKIKFNFRNDGHFGQFNTVSKKANIFGWNMLRSTMFQVCLEKSIKY